MYKDLIKDKKLVAFDLDGTVIQSNMLWKKAFDTIASANNIYAFPQFAEGLSLDAKWQTVLTYEQKQKTLSVKDLVKQTNDTFIKLLHETPPEVTDGFWELGIELKQDKKLQLALTTNSPRYVLDAISKEIGFGETFDFTLTADEVKAPKPDPAIYTKLLVQTKLSPQQVLVFEDSITGVQAAVKAKLDTVVLWDGKTPQGDFPNKNKGFITDFTGLIGNFELTKNEFAKEYIKNLNDWIDNHKLKERLGAKATNQ